AVQGPVVVEVAEQEETAGEEPDDGGDPLAHIEPVGAKDAEEGQQYPADVVVLGPDNIAALGGAVHGRDQEQVHYPANKKQAQGKKVDGAADGAAVVEA